MKINKRSIRLKGLLGISTVTLVAGGCWLTRQINFLKENLQQAMPVDVMAGLNKNSSYIYLSEDSMAYRSELEWENHFTHMTKKLAYPRISWEIVFLARAKERHHRLLGLRVLSSLNNLNDSVCQEIAQASDYQMAVGLARSQTADLRLLLPPPPLPSLFKNSDLHDDLSNMLQSLLSYKLNTCAGYFTLLALQQMQYSQGLGGDADFDWSEESYKKLRRPTRETLSILFLNSLLAHSSTKDQSKVLMNMKIFPLLMKLNKDSIWVQSDKTRSVIAKVLGNLALNELFHYSIFQSGWISEIAKWARSDNLELALTSNRVLANLDRMNGLNKYENGIYLAHPCHFEGERDIDFDVIFVHGLLGGAFKTWRQEDRNKIIETTENTSYTHCWPKDWLPNDLPNIRVILVDFETRLSEWSSHCPYENSEGTIKARSENIINKLKAAGVGKRPIIWVSHSMGGLLVKQILILSKAKDSFNKIFKQTKGAIFFSVPHRGSKIASSRFGSQYFTFPSPEVKELHYESKLLLELDDNFMKAIEDINLPCLSFCETKETKLGHMNLSAKFVSKESANINVGDFHLIDSDHLYICKPLTSHSFVYQKVVKFIENQINNFKHDPKRLDEFEILNST